MVVLNYLNLKFLIVYRLGSVDCRKADCQCEWADQYAYASKVHSKSHPLSKIGTDVSLWAVWTECDFLVVLNGLVRVDP